MSPRRQVSQIQNRIFSFSTIISTALATMADEIDDPGVDFHGGMGDDPDQLDGEEVMEDDPEVKEIMGDEVDDAADEQRTNIRGSGNAPKSVGSDQEEAIVQCDTSAGPITMHFYRSWSPHGYDRATKLFEKGYFDHSHFFRVVEHFLVQFGIGYTTDKELKAFSLSTIPDDPKRPELLPFKEGMMSFAGSGPNSRSSQMFIAYDRAGGLGQSPWETPFGKVTSGLENVKNFYKGYGDMPPWGKGPQQGPIHNRGASYIESDFPLLDKFETCSVQRMNQSGAGVIKDVNVIKQSDTEVIQDANVVKNVAAEIKKANVVNKAETKEEVPSFPFTTLLILSSIVLSVLLGLGYMRNKKKKKYNNTT
jgi:cyclophilin family peptidyl-prolyl cis-trans isomerase